jgi:endonuclease-3
LRPIEGEADMATMSRAAAAEAFRRFQDAAPRPETELHYKNHFTLLVAVVLSAQATDAGVNRATPALFAVADTPAKMAALSEERLASFIRTIGLWRTKAKNIIALSKALVRDHGGEVPSTREELEKLPGVGRKTANVMLNAAFGQPTLAVDTHVFRVANRTGLAPGKTPTAVEERLMKIVPTEYLQGAHHWLILHGRYVCKAKAPDCPNCIVADLCLFKDKSPAKGFEKAAAKRRPAKRLVSKLKPRAPGGQRNGRAARKRKTA